MSLTIRAVETERPRCPRAALSEAELLRRLLDNDARAWRVFVEGYHRLLRVTIERILSRFAARYVVDVDDVYAALMASLVANGMAKLRSFDPQRGTKLSTWLGILASNITWDYLRESQRRSALADALRDGELRSENPDAVRLVLARERCMRVGQLWDALSAGERRIFELLYVQGVSPDEVAARLHISVKTVYTRCHKLRAKLQPALREEILRPRKRASSARARQSPPSRTRRECAVAAV